LQCHCDFYSDGDDLALYATGGSLAYLQVTGKAKAVLAYSDADRKSRGSDGVPVADDLVLFSLQLRIDIRHDDVYADQ